MYAVLTGTLLVNQAYVLYWLNITPGGASPNLTGDPVVLVVSIINLVMFLYGTLLVVGILRGQPMKTPTALPTSQTAKGEMHSDIRPENNQS